MSSPDPTPKMYHVTVTVLRLQLTSIPRFAWFAFGIPGQAARSPGNVRTETTIHLDGMSYTLTVWESRQHMLAFMRSGAHGRAMRHLRTIASFAKTYSCDRVDIPTLAEAIHLIDTQGRYVFDHRPKGNGESRGSSRVYVAAAAVALLGGLGYWASTLTAGRGGALAA